MSNRHLIRLVIILCLITGAVCEAGCPDGWTLSTNAICYLIQPSPLTFQEAQTRCQADGAKLISVWNKAEWEILLNFSQLHLGNETYFWSGRFIGQRSDGSTYWRWKDGSAYAYIKVKQDSDKAKIKGNALTISTLDGHYKSHNESEKFPSACKIARSKIFKITHEDFSTINDLAPTQKWTNSAHAVFFASVVDVGDSVISFYKDVETFDDCYLWCLTTDRCIQIEAKCSLLHTCGITKCTIRVTL